MKSRWVGPALLGLLIVAPGCERERRDFRTAPPAVRSTGAFYSQLRPGELTPPPPSPANSYEENAQAVADGRRLYGWYNCSGCHFHGGGGIGPPLMDDAWIYGSDPANIFATIIEGRPNGMPAYGGHIPDFQVWQLVAYVRSMSGLVASDVAPGRADRMQIRQPATRSEKPQSQNTGD